MFTLRLVERVPMTDLFAHVCLAYVVGGLISLRVDWLDAHYVTVVLVGAVIPELVKIELLVEARVISNLLIVPFSWEPLQTLGGVVVSLCVGGLIVCRCEQRRVLPLLALGAATHIFLDYLLLSVSGRSFAVFWPFTRYHPPTPGLYLSTDILPTIVASLLAMMVWILTSHVD